MRRFRLEILLGLGLVAATLAAYARAPGYEFINFDDHKYVSENPLVLGGLTRANVAWAWTTYHTANWHPLTWLSLQLDAQCFGTNPTAFHAVNLLLHAGNVVLLFIALCYMTQAAWRSAFVAGLFALHPLHVESVAWVAERKDVLSTFFGLLAILAYAHYAAHPGPRRYVPVVLAFALSLLAKPTLVTLPFVLLLLDYWPFCRLRFLRPNADKKSNEPRFPLASLDVVIIEKLPLLLLSVFSSIMTMTAQRQGGAVAPLEALPMSLRLENALVACSTYLQKTFWPQGLAVHYPHSRESYPSLQLATAALVLALLTAIALSGWKRRPYLLVGWLWFLGTLVPVIGLVQVGGQAMADRYTYIPHIGLFIMVVWGISALLDRWRCPTSVRVVLAGAVLVSCGVLTWIQAGFWHDSITLWEHTLQVTQRNYQAHANLGSAYLDRGNLSEGAKHIRAALAINGYDPELHLLLGKTLLDLDLDEQAVEPLRAALALRPNFGRAHHQLGLAYLRLGKVNEAREHFQVTVKNGLGTLEGHTELGWLYLHNRDFDKAAEHFQAALRFRQRSAQAHLGMAIVDWHRHSWNDAIYHLEQAASIERMKDE